MRPRDNVIVLLTDFQAWCRTSARPTDATLLDYVGFTATPDALFGFAALFQPDLVIHEGHHFLASGFSAATFDAWRTTGLSLREVQRVMNHIHVSTLLQNQDVDDVVACEAARVLAAIWRRTLGPEGLAVEHFGSALHDAGATFYRLPPDARSE